MPEKNNYRPKRRIKNPETFRERALKATSQESVPDKKLTSGVASRSGKIFRPIASAISKLAELPLLKQLFRVLRPLGRIIFPKYFRSSFTELKQVTWPNLKQSRRLTTAVIIFAIIFGASVAVLDYGLDHLFKNVLLK